MNNQNGFLPNPVNYRDLLSYLKKVERTFLEEGGIKERMTAARKVVRGY